VAPPQLQSRTEETVFVRSSTVYLRIEECGRKLQELRLGHEPLTIGRAADNDVVIGARCVSLRHARIDPEGFGHRIVDLRSESGLLVRGQRVSSHLLLDGDVVRIADPSTGNFVSLTYRDVGKQAQRQPTEPVQRLPLVGELTTIGREGCDLDLPNLQVSRLHAEVLRVDGALVLHDRASINGVFVNGQRIDKHALKVGDVIQIGPFKLVFDGEALDQFDQQGAMRLDARSLTRSAGGRRILDHASLVVEPCEFVAIVGPSGAGKSTLMGALSGYQHADEGLLLVNGDDLYAKFDAYRAVVGYVPQDDIVHANLRVDEALRFTAELRLSPDTSAAEIEGRISRVLEDVRMSEHRHKSIHQLSGGQRKRVSIASELISDPSLFFLDEPTSGLDPGLEKRMMYTLRYLADSGRTVVLVTHATANIMQCDLVVFMADGRVVFYGPPAAALEMFKVTSGDFADIYTKLDGQVGAEPDALSHGELAAEYTIWREHHPEAKAPPTQAALWEIRYRMSEEYRRYVYERQQRADSGHDSSLAPLPLDLQAIAPGMFRYRVAAPVIGGVARPREPSEVRVSLLRQATILMRRYLRLVVSDRRNLWILLLQAPVIGVVLLLAARREALQNVVSSNGRLLLFLLAVVAVWFGVLNSVREVTKEARIYRRERLANLRISAYLFSKVGVLAGLCLVQSLILALVIALKVDFSAAVEALTDEGLVAIVRAPPFGLWGATLVTVFLTSLTGIGLGLLISTLVSNSDKAMSVVPLALIPQLVFAMALMPLPAAIAPISYLTGARWGMEALGSIANMVEPRDMTTCEIPGLILTCEPFATVNYDPSTRHVVTTWTILIVYTVVCLLLTAWSLRRREQRGAAKPRATAAAGVT
jgi:ABC-type multidrug transport system ATPase subunit/pSer/pThr/pTyr-binding forkhead associated (FHA) protein/ABC-type multidrug transport system permease subunit